jgi:hypothetical protein
MPAEAMVPWIPWISPSLSTHFQIAWISFIASGYSSVIRKKAIF